jgi:hypothetical protein
MEALRSPGHALERTVGSQPVFSPLCLPSDKVSGLLYHSPAMVWSLARTPKKWDQLIMD